MVKIDFKDVGEKLKGGAINIFSLRNLTVSLLSALLVIGLSYLSGVVGQLIQPKAYSNPIIYLVYFLVTIVLYVIAITGPAFLAAVYKKDWASFMYIIILEMVWLCIFVGVLYFTTPSKDLSPMMQLE